MPGARDFFEVKGLWNCSDRNRPYSCFYSGSTVCVPPDRAHVRAIRSPGGHTTVKLGIYTPAPTRTGTLCLEDGYLDSVKSVYFP